MINLLSLTTKSLRNRRGTVALTMASIGLSVALLFGVERIRREVQTSFTNTVSGTDLIVGARSSPVALLLSSVFHIGDASNNMEWESAQMLAGHPAVDWTIPLSLGDSHRGYRVLGTTDTYFNHFQYGRKQPLELLEGQWFSSDEAAVVGAEVADALDYKVGDQIVVAHGAGEISFIEHDEHPFRVVGILERTGTPVDRTVHVSLGGIDAMHVGLTTSSCDHKHDPLAICNHDHSSAGPSITALLVGLKSRAGVLSVQRMVNEYKSEALTAAVPGLTLQELWEVVGMVEKVLLAISWFVVLVGLGGMLASLMTSLNERRREMAILRSVGARPGHIFGLIAGESMLVTLSGILFGVVLLYVLQILLSPYAVSKLGMRLPITGPTIGEYLLGTAILFAGLLVGLIPAYRSYRFSLADGLRVKL